MRKIIILASIVFLNLGIAHALENKGNTLSTQGGKFVFGQISEFRQDQFMLNTETGELWIKVQDADGMPVLTRVSYARGVDIYSNLPYGQTFKYHTTSKVTTSPPAGFTPE